MFWFVTVDVLIYSLKRSEDSVLTSSKLYVIQISSIRLMCCLLVYYYRVYGEIFICMVTLMITSLGLLWHTAYAIFCLTTLVFYNSWLGLDQTLHRVVSSESVNSIQSTIIKWCLIMNLCLTMIPLQKAKVGVDLIFWFLSTYLLQFYLF